MSYCLASWMSLLRCILWTGCIKKHGNHPSHSPQAHHKTMEILPAQYFYHSVHLLSDLKLIASPAAEWGVPSCSDSYTPYSLKEYCSKGSRSVLMKVSVFCTASTPDTFCQAPLIFYTLKIQRVTVTIRLTQHSLHDYTMPSLLNTATDCKTTGTSFESIQASRCWCQMPYTMTRTCVYVYASTINADRITSLITVTLHIWWLQNQYTWLSQVQHNPSYCYTRLHSWCRQKGLDSPLPPHHHTHSTILLPVAVQPAVLVESQKERQL